MSANKTIRAAVNLPGGTVTPVVLRAASLAACGWCLRVVARLAKKGGKRPPFCAGLGKCSGLASMVLPHDSVAVVVYGTFGEAAVMVVV